MTLRAARRRFRPTEMVAVGVALACSLGLILVAVATPFYSSVSGQVSSDAVVTHESTSATLVDVNGTPVLVIVAIPLLITLAVSGILFIRGIERGPGAVAWTLVGLLAVLTLAGMLTIGPLIVPVTGCLVTACGVRQVRQQRH